MLIGVPLTTSRVDSISMEHPRSSPELPSASCRHFAPCISNSCLRTIALTLKVIALRLEAIATWVKAIATMVEAIAGRDKITIENYAPQASHHRHSEMPFQRDLRPHPSIGGCLLYTPSRAGRLLKTIRAKPYLSSRPSCLITSGMWRC